MRGRLGANLAAAAALLAAVGYLAWRGANQVVSTSGWVAHTYQTIGALETVISGLKDAESEVRYFVLTGREDGLSSYSSTLEQMDRSLDRLAGLMADNPAQIDRLATLRERGKDALDQLRAVIEVRRLKGMAAARAVSAGRGSHRMDGVRALVNRMEDEELRLLAARQAREKTTFAWAAAGVSALCVLSTGLFMSLVRLGLRENSALSDEIVRRQLLIDNVRDYAVIELDPGGTVTSWNQGAERIKGYRPEEIIGKSFSVFYTPEDVKAGLPERLLSQAAADGRVEQEGWRVRKDGTRFSADAIISAIRVDGRLRGFVKVTRDVTDKLRAERALRDYAKKLEQSNKELDAFSYSVSHDLRAPLRAIDGFALMLQEDHAARLGDEGRRLLNVICENARRMGRLIDDLLAFSRLGRKELDKADVDMEALTDSVIAELKGAGAAAAIERGSLPPAKADPSLLRQVMVNLVSNALKFSSLKQDARVVIGSQAGTDGVAYFVNDNGAGFDMAYAHKLFGIFQRLHAADEFEGTGVGLALVSRIIGRHGGRVWAEGRLGQGATFYFTLPANDSQGESA